MPVALISTRTSPAFGPSRSSSTISSGFFASNATAARVFICHLPQIYCLSSAVCSFEIYVRSELLFLPIALFGARPRRRVLEPGRVSVFATGALHACAGRQGGDFKSLDFDLGPIPPLKQMHRVAACCIAA